MDLVSASVEKLEPLPSQESEVESSKLQEWIENMKERADRLGGNVVQFTLGQHYFSRGHYNEALSYFEKASDGCGQAKYQLGVMHFDGLGIPKDMTRGFQYMLEVASSSHRKDTDLLPCAQYNVGRAYFMGFGAQQSDDEAESWWLRAANHDVKPSAVRAQSTLGMFYTREETFDSSKAFHWTQLAAENGHLEAMAALGLLCVRGSRGNEEGLQWLKRSSEGGCVYGTGLLAHLYLIRKLFSKAAETAYKVSEVTEPVCALDNRGVAIGCFVLGRCLQLGQAVSKDQEKAHHYYTKAVGLDKRVVAELHDLLTHGKV